MKAFSVNTKLIRQGRGCHGLRVYLAHKSDCNSILTYVGVSPIAFNVPFTGHNLAQSKLCTMQQDSGEMPHVDDIS